MPTSARRRHRIGTGGPWGSGLLLLGVAVTVQGIGYSTAGPDRLPDALQVMPVTWLWGGLWIAAGLWSIWKALTPPQQHWEVLPVVGVMLLWSVAHAAHWLILGLAYGQWTRGWSSAVGWGMLAGLIIAWGRCVNPPQGQR